MRKSDSVVFLVAGLLTVSPSGLTAGNLSAEADGIRVELSTDPERPARGQETTYELRLFDSAGKPLTGARVALHGRMADGMTVLAPLRPLRSIHIVTWKNERSASVLKSAREVLAAEKAGEITIERPGLVANMPLVTWPGGRR